MHYGITRVNYLIEEMLWPDDAVDRLWRGVSDGAAWKKIEVSRVIKKQLMLQGLLLVHFLVNLGAHSKGWSTASRNRFVPTNWKFQYEGVDALARVTMNHSLMTFIPGFTHGKNCCKVLLVHFLVNLGAQPKGRSTTCRRLVNRYKYGQSRPNLYLQMENSNQKG